jgi:hypothetical protein
MSEATETAHAPTSRFTKEKTFHLPEYIQRARVKAESYDYATRVQGIDEIAADTSETGARLLLHLLASTGWRGTKQHILLKLSRFLNYERVFYALAAMLETTDDTQLCMWVLDAFKYSGINRYDRFLTTVYHNVNGKLKEQVFDTLLYLCSPFVNELIGGMLREHDIYLNDGVEGATLYARFVECPIQMQVSFLQYVGTFNLVGYKALCIHFTRHTDPYVASCALINLMKIGVDYYDLEQNFMDSTMGQLCATTAIRDEILNLFHENRRLKKDISLSAWLDRIFSEPADNSSNREILFLNTFIGVNLIERLSPYQEERSLELMLRILSLVKVDGNQARQTVFAYCGRVLDHRCLARAISFVWDHHDTSVLELLNLFFGRVEGDLRDPNTSLVNPRLFFSNLTLPEKPKPVIARCLKMLTEGCMCQASAISMINMLVLEYRQRFTNEKLRLAIEQLLNAALQHFMEMEEWHHSQGIVLRLCRAFGQIRYNSKVLYRYFRQIFFSSELSFSERNGMLWILAQNRDNINAHKMAVSIQMFAFMIKRYQREGVVLVAIGNSDSEELLLHCFMTDRHTLTVQSLLTLVENVDRGNWLALLQVVWHQPLAEAWPWLSRLIATTHELTHLERIWLVKCLGKYTQDTAVDFLARSITQDDEILRHLSAYSLSKIPMDRAIISSLKVVSDMLEGTYDRMVIGTIFQYLSLPVIAFDETVKDVLAILSRLTDEELYNSAAGYLARLQTQGQAARCHLLHQKHSNLVEELIKRISTEVVHFAELSSTVQSVVLSAEIPLHHPELFDHSIDKSTSILQYIKAVDIYLNDKIGVLLLEEKYYRRLQDLVLNTGLDNIATDLVKHQDLSTVINANNLVLKKLGLTGFFEAKEFPIIKFSHIVSAIVNNSLVQSDFKVIDGLKAWGLLMFLMLRTFPGSFPEAILPVKEGPSVSLIDVCKRMFALQEYRNPIAHRQTIFEPLPVEQAKTKAFCILNDLQILFD